MIILFAIIASFAAFLGGMIALKMRDKLHLVLGFSAGAVVGAALFDLIPEAIGLGAGAYQPGGITSLVAAGFMIYLVLDRLFLFHGHDHESAADCGCERRDDETVGHAEDDGGVAVRGSLGAGSFCLHSLIDGIAIGLSFQASAAIGVIVSVAVIAHRFSDGINTVGVILRHRGQMRHALWWLVAVALAPIVGTLATFVFTVSENVLAIILALFAGFFLYIGGSDLIPEGHHSHSRMLTTLMTVIGIVSLYVIVMIAG